METAGPGTLIDHTQHIPTPDRTRCSGCGRCVAACTRRLLTLETEGFRKTAIKLQASNCTNCGRCVESCPISALSS